jgi:hypothetical protein
VNVVRIFFFNSLAENAAKITSLQAEIALFTRNNNELKVLNEALRDEHQALHLAYTALEDKIRKAQVPFKFSVKWVRNHATREHLNSCYYVELAAVQFQFV